MAGLLDNYLLPAEVQREANIRGLLGTLIGIGKASGPSSAPVGLGTIAASGADAGLQAMDQYERGQTQRSLVGAQIGKLKAEEAKRTQALQYIRSLPPEQQQRAMAQLTGIGANELLGNVPTQFGYGADGTINPRFLDSKRQEQTQSKGIDTAFDVLGSFSKYQAPVPYTAGGGVRQYGASPEDAQGVINQLLGPGGLTGQGSPLPPAGPVSTGPNTMRAPATVTPMEPLGLDMRTGASDRAMGPRIPPQQQREFQAPGVPPATVYGSQPERRFEYRRGDAFGGIYEKMLNRSMEIGGERQKLGRLDMLLDQIYTGTGGDIVDKAKRAGQMLGIDLGTVGPGEAAGALGNELALQLRNPAGGAGMPGAMSDADREYLRNMVPGLANTKEGRKLMLETRLKLLDREQEIGRMARRYVKENKGQLDEGFLDKLEEYSAKTPLFNDADRQKLEGVGKAGGGGLPEGVPEGSKQIGTKDGKPVYLTPDNRRLLVD